MTEKKHNDGSGSHGDQPKQIGPYRILDTLGEGGMSVVYLAEQSEPVKRRVALKILKAGMDSKQVVARFESERQALAVLDHPNIAKIFDGGIAESGRPYFAMEQVKGVPITDYCDNQRLSNEERLKVFIKVCSAVQHAHLKGLIHRDLKPSNILVGVVDGKPEPKIIDFGIAKATTTTLTEATLYTRVGQIIGTPQYMSPEQADLTGLDIDTRTDIYSLGVVLYELLVGTVPLDLRAIGDHAMQTAIREKEPSKPSTRFTELGDTREEVAKVRRTNPDRLRHQLQGDLDWIVMRAIEKDRTRRYETVNALSMECRRFINHEPVLARPPSPGYLLQRFVRRNRLAVAAGSIAILAIIAGAAAATLGFIRATEAEQVAVREARTARATTQFLVDLFQVSDPWSFSPVSTEAGADISASEVLNLGAERIRTELIDQPEVQASLMTAIGRVFIGLDSLEKAESLLLDGMEVRRREFSPRDPSIGDSLRSLGRLYYINGDYEKSENALREAVSIFQDVRGDNSLDMSSALGLLSVTLSNKGELQEALDVQTRALEILRSRPETDQLQMGLGLNNLGHVHYLLDEPQLGISAFEEAVALLAETNAHGHHASALGNLAAMYQVMGRLSEAQQAHEKALTVKREWFGPEHIEVGFGVANLSMVYLMLDDFDKAAILQREAIDIFADALGDDHPNVGIVKGNLAWALKGQRNYAEAESMFRDSLEHIQRTLGPEHLNLTNIYNGIGELYAEQNQYKEAEQHFRNTLRITATADPGYSEAGAARAGIAKLPVSSLSVLERKEYYASALETLGNSEGLGTPRAAVIQMDFAAFLAEQGEETRARELFEAGLMHLSVAITVDNQKYREHASRYEQLFGQPPSP